MRVKLVLGTTDLEGSTVLWVLLLGIPIGSHSNDMRKISPGSSKGRKRLMILKYTQKFLHNKSQRKRLVSSFMPSRFRAFLHSSLL